ncbi:ATP-binding cassette domain-containing protein [Alteromonas sp. KUL49]|uniref:ATP-binding cassette domain-containing protein n=1 Tax=Alteromonas sp. KUL49 TaxID=2480798 RepID=UPI00102F15B0|nr:ATP-binding cassette domain-containing protein [Alteromonas sp. KUL49]TAP36851.1 ATP-binding cassette domain-containing protein [Alteromonas sp. KUL49]GEA13113.1 ABC transporter ATP-binding protein [Alteromonas sp. KUL49]
MALELIDLSVTKDKHALFNVNARVEPGKVLSVLGASGSGKSTLLNAVTGQLESVFTVKGDIVLNGESIIEVPTYQRRVGVLFQDALLFEHLTVGENIEFGFRNRKNTQQSVAQLLGEVEMQDMQHRSVSSLSGGQQARVALLRTMASEPKAMLLDEPFSKLDTQLRAKVREWVFSTVKVQNIPTIMVTHDAEDVDAANGDIIQL